MQFTALKTLLLLLEATMNTVINALNSEIRKTFMGVLKLKENTIALSLNKISINPNNKPVVIVHSKLI
uniref:Transposase n=1 Tax=Acrobeloides nanus TaxID=290746 RepID=A0A914DI90_9BILA